MRIDFELPEPTITLSEARDRIVYLSPLQRKFFNGQKKLILEATKKPISKYRLRQIVEHIELARKRAVPLRRKRANGKRLPFSVTVSETPDTDTWDWMNE